MALTALTTIVSVFVMAVYFSLPSNVLSLRGEQPLRAFFGGLLPQGWGFFTKAPDSPEMTPYVVQDGLLHHASSFPNSASKNQFGISREQRAQGPEMAKLSNAAQDTLDCDEVEGDCRLAAVERLRPTRVRNLAPAPTLCGRVVIMETVPVPWVFRDDYDGWRIDTQAVLLEVECQPS